MKKETKDRDEMIIEISRIQKEINQYLLPDDGKSDDQLKKELDLLTELAEKLSKPVPTMTEEKLKMPEEVETLRREFKDSPLAYSENDMSKLRKFFTSIRHSGIKDFRRYFESHPEAVAKCAVLVKRTYVNPATLKLYRADGIEDFTDGLTSIFHEESYRVFREELIALAEGETSFEKETVVFTLQGEKRNIYLKIMVVPGYEASLARVLAFVVDITERKRAEAMLEDMRESLARAGLE